jgi:hypothetical protein
MKNHIVCNRVKRLEELFLGMIPRFIGHNAYDSDHHDVYIEDLLLDGH